MMNIRPATSADIGSLIQLERRCAEASHWSQEQYQSLFQTDAGGLQRLVLVIETAAEDDSAAGRTEKIPLSGFLVARQIPPEWELENIGVDPSLRRSGLGAKLLQTLLIEAQRTHSDSVFLEVRESNQAARALYEKAGFRESGRRKSYYANPYEDAILYRLEMRGLHRNA
jgi:[ribosomal protein S18]-alanine N-acetyltransferase